MITIFLINCVFEISLNGSDEENNRMVRAAYHEVDQIVQLTDRVRDLQNQVRSLEEKRERERDFYNKNLAQLIAQIEQGAYYNQQLQDQLNTSIDQLKLLQAVKEVQAWQSTFELLKVPKTLPENYLVGKSPETLKKLIANLQLAFAQATRQLKKETGK